MMIWLWFVTIMCIGNLAESLGFGVELILAKLEAIETRLMDLEKFNYHLNNTLQALNSSCFASLKGQGIPTIQGLSPRALDRPLAEAATRNISSEAGHLDSYLSGVNYPTRYDYRSNISRQSYQHNPPFHLRPETPTIQGSPPRGIDRLPSDVATRNNNSEAENLYSYSSRANYTNGFWFNIPRQSYQHIPPFHLRPETPTTQKSPRRTYDDYIAEAATRNISSEAGNLYSYSSRVNYTYGYDGKDYPSNISRQSYQQIPPGHLPDRGNSSRRYREYYLERTRDRVSSDN